jgi:hypothetical protein
MTTAKIVGDISPSDSLQLLEDLGARDAQVDLDWIVDRVHGNIFVLALLADYSKKYPGKLPHHPELVTADAMPIIQAHWEQQSPSTQDLLKRMCVLRIGMNARELTLLRLLQPDVGTIEVMPENESETVALLSELVNCGLVLATKDISGESLYVLHDLMTQTLQAKFYLELNRLWGYAARLYACFAPPKDLSTFENWRLFHEELHFWWLLGRYEAVSKIVIGCLLPLLEKWGKLSLQQEWCDRVLPHTKGTNHQYCLQMLEKICQHMEQWDDAGNLDTPAPVTN